MKSENVSSFFYPLILGSKTLVCLNSRDEYSTYWNPFNELKRFEIGGVKSLPYESQVWVKLNTPHLHYVHFVDRIRRYIFS